MLHVAMLYACWLPDLYKPALHVQRHLRQLGVCVQSQHNVPQVGKVSDHVQLLPQSVQSV